MAKRKSKPATSSQLRERWARDMVKIGNEFRSRLTQEQRLRWELDGLKMEIFYCMKMLRSGIGNAHASWNQYWISRKSREDEWDDPLAGITPPSLYNAYSLLPY